MCLITNWSFSIGLEKAWGGADRAIEQKLINAGFGYSDDAGVEHPFSEAGLSWFARIDYAFKAPFSLGAILSNARIGSTTGYQNMLDLSLKVDYSVITFAPIASIHVYGFRLGIGPTMNWTKLSMQNVSKSSNRIGLLLDAAWIFPFEAHFFVMARFQYLSVGDVKFGDREFSTFEVFDDFGSGAFVSMPNPLSYSYKSAGIGIGMRL